LVNALWDADVAYYVQCFQKIGRSIAVAVDEDEREL
jgi:hypothetical protein